MIYLREQWIKHPTLKKYTHTSCTDTKCSCNSPQVVELCEHDSCIRGRIDTKVCTNCDGIVSFQIVR